jgi:RNA polymerase sigma factor (sigma-70 family)
MNVHFSYKLSRTPDLDREIQHGTEKVRKRLQVFRPELVHLKGLVEQNSSREGIVVSLNLRLPSGQMASQESAPNASAAIKAAFDSLLSQIGKHKELLRNSHKWHRRRAQGGRPVPQVPFEQTVASIPPLAATPDDVRTYVNANFRRLQTYVERELYFRESSGDIESDSINSEEIVDQAVADALDEKNDKPDRIGIEPWLYRLAIRAIDDAVSRRSEADTEVELRGMRQRRRERASDEARLQFHQPDEAMTNESGIPDRGAPTPEEVAYTDEMVALVQVALNGAAPQDRETFVLHALEGFTVEEIAAITDRNREEIEQSIARAREKLRNGFATNNPFQRRLLQATATR